MPGPLLRSSLGLVSESKEPVTMESMACLGTRLPTAPTRPRSRLRLPNWMLVTNPEFAVKVDPCSLRLNKIHFKEKNVMVIRVKTKD